MMFLGVLKRIVPFFLTFAAGLFIASFFINIASPSFNFPRKSHKFREMQRLRQDNDRLQRENAELRRQLEETGVKTGWAITSGPQTFDPPTPPPAPRVQYPRHDR